jgi:hypothetical protein
MIRQNKRGGRNRQNNGQNRSIPAPPSFNATFQSHKTLRFEASSASPAGGTLITSQDLYDLLCMATSTTAAYDLFSGLRLRKIRIWGPMPSSLVPVTVAIEYLANSTVGQPSRIKCDTSIGSTKAAYVEFAPPAKSLLDFWVPSVSATSLIALTFPANAIVDVVMDFVLQNGETPEAVGAAVSGATVGKIYCRALDSNGSGLLSPVQYPTI